MLTVNWLGIDCGQGYVEVINGYADLHVVAAVVVTVVPGPVGIGRYRHMVGIFAQLDTRHVGDGTDGVSVGVAPVWRGEDRSVAYGD